MAQGFTIIVKMTAIPRSKSTAGAPKLRFQPSDLYKIRICKAASGEEIALLASAQTALPVVRPNQFILVARRDRSQFSTLKGDLGVLAVLLSWAHHHTVDLDEAIDRGTGLDQSAVVSLVDALRVNYSKRKSPANVVNLKAPLVCPEVWASRIALARDYVAWSLADVLTKCEVGTLRYQGRFGVNEGRRWASSPTGHAMASRNCARDGCEGGGGARIR